MQSTMLAAFENKREAENLHRFLEGRGVKSALADLTVEQPGNAIPGDFAKYQVFVAEGFERDAFEAAHRTDEGVRLLQPAIRCPECGSLNVIYPSYPRNFLLPALLRFLVKVRFLEGEYCCMTCRHEWAPSSRERKKSA